MQYLYLEKKEFHNFIDYYYILNYLLERTKEYFIISPADTFLLKVSHHLDNIIFNSCYILQYESVYFTWRGLAC